MKKMKRLLSLVIVLCIMASMVVITNITSSAYGASISPSSQTVDLANATTCTVTGTLDNSAPWGWGVLASGFYDGGVTSPATWSGSNPWTVDVSNCSPGSTITVTANAQFRAMNIYQQQKDFYATATGTIDVTCSHNGSRGGWQLQSDTATCTASGTKTYRCSVCGATKTESSAALGHNFTSKTTTPTYLKSEANCTSKAVYYYKCSRCEASSKNNGNSTYTSGSVNSSNHNWGSWTQTTAPTCTTAGVETRTCTRNSSHTETRTGAAATGHTPNAGTVTTPATCTANGLKTYNCTVCGAVTSTESIPAAGHSFTSQTKTSTYLKSAATCTEDAVYYYKCANCSESSNGNTNTTYTDVGSAPGHNYNSVVTAPTCTVDGYTTHTCSVCGDTYTDSTVTAPGHTWPSDWTVATPASCSATGLKEKRCTVCSTLLDSEPIPTVEHTWGVGVESPVATCTTDGTITYTCTVCGATTTETVTAPGHNYEVTSNTATCTAAGTKTYTCSRCSDSYTEPSVALGHDYSSVVTPPTCEEAGYTTHTCSRCGDEYTDTPVAATGHDWGAWTLTADPSAPARGTETRVCGNNPAHTQTRTSDIVDKTTNTEIAITADTLTADRCNDKIVSVTASVDPGDTSFSELRYRVVNSSYIGPYNDIADNDVNVVATGNVIESESWISTPQSGTINLNTHEWPAGTYRVMLAAYINSGSRSLTGGRQTDYYQYATITVENTGHTWDAGVVTPPTCTVDGYTTYTCTDCGETMQDDVVAALGHNYVLSSTTTAPTCTSAGEGVYTCSRCGDEITDTIAIDPSAHTYDDGVVTTEPTCTVAGEKLYTCQNDNSHTSTEVLPALGHNIDGVDWTVTVSPTYSSTGTRVKYCSRCGVVVVSETMSALTAPTAVTVTPASSIVEVGATQQLTPTFTPADATAVSATWTSSDTSVATVSSTGLITGVSTGAVMITYTLDSDPTVTDSVSVTVVPAQGSGTVDLVDTHPDIDLNVGTDTTSVTVTGTSCEANADGSNTFNFNIGLSLSSPYINTVVEENEIVAVITLDNNFAAPNGYRGVSGSTVYPAVADSVYIPLSAGSNVFSIVSPSYIQPDENGKVMWHVSVYLGGTVKAPKNELLYNSIIEFENSESGEATLAVSVIGDPLVSQSATTKNIKIDYENISSLAVAVEHQNPATGIYTSVPALASPVTLTSSGQGYAITINGSSAMTPGTTIRLTFTAYDSSHNVVATDKCYLVASWIN